MTPSAMATIVADRVLAVVRAPEIPDPGRPRQRPREVGDTRS